MDKKIIIIGIVGVIGIITIASVAVYEFLQQQDDRRKALNTINAADLLDALRLSLKGYNLS